MSMFTSVFPKLLGKTPMEQGAYDSIAITPADGTDVALNDQGQGIKRLYVTGAGNVNVNLLGGGTAVLTGLSAGQSIAIAVTRVLATSTTATGVIGVYGQD